MREEFLDFTFRARYFDSGPTPENTKAIWFVFHGYGQLAFYFGKKFDVLHHLGIRVIAPEGLHRYYLEGSSGRVGASWMTREDRLTDIRNYLVYLDAVHDRVRKEIGRDTPLTGLGFSQGAATVCRWLLHGKTPFRRLILWAGLFPPDLPVENARERLDGKQVDFVYGLQDPYLSDQRFKEMEELTALLGVSPQVTAFDGKHTIDSATLLKIVNQDSLRT